MKGLSYVPLRSRAATSVRSASAGSSTRTRVASGSKGLSRASSGGGASTRSGRARGHRADARLGLVLDVARDQPGPARHRDVGPGPVDQHDDAIPEADEIEDVDD